MKLGKDVVRITWEDAWSINDYFSDETIHKETPLILTSIGTVIRNDKKGMAIAKTLNPQSRTPYRDVHFIPRGMVRKVKVLK